MDDSQKQTGLHPISVVADRTGLSADLLRMWERRYGVVVPTRDEAGRRLYTDADVDRLKLLAQATNAGRSVGQLVALPVEQLQELVRSDETARWTAVRPPELAAGEQEFVARGMDRTRALDGCGLEVELRRAAAIFGLPRLLEGVVSPLLRRIGDAWHAGQMSIAQEHLASAVIRAVVTELGTAVPSVDAAPIVVVATAPGERHEIGALLVAAAAAVEGWRVTYLGADLPAEEIAAAAARSGARVVAISSVYSLEPGRVGENLARLREALPADIDLVVGGAAANRLNGRLPAGVQALHTLTELGAYLRESV